MIDPVAAAMVFGATAKPGAAPHNLIGLNVTMRCTQTAEQFRVRHRAAVPPVPAVLEMAEAYFRRRRQVAYNDPLAAAVVFAPDLCTFETGVVTMVVNARGEDAARTFFAPDRAGAGRDKPSNHCVAKGVKVERFFDEYFDTLCGTLPADRL